MGGSLQASTNIHYYSLTTEHITVTDVLSVCTSANLCFHTWLRIAAVRAIIEGHMEDCEIMTHGLWVVIACRLIRPLARHELIYKTHMDVHQRGPCADKGEYNQRANCAYLLNTD